MREFLKKIKSSNKINDSVTLDLHQRIKCRIKAVTDSGKSIGILGFDGGKLLKKCDLTIHIKTEKNEYGPVEDVQLILNHIFAHWFQKKYVK